MSYDGDESSAPWLIDPKERQDVDVHHHPYSFPDLHPSDAQVVAVDRQQQSIVLNLGTRQGAKEGMPFRILRGDKVVGSCRLLEVRELISAGLPEQLGEGIQIQVGDRIAVLAQK